jgi:hypothetical protein
MANTAMSSGNFAANTSPLEGFRVTTDASKVLYGTYKVYGR